MDFLIEPFRHAFMQHALLAAVLVGITCAVLGVHVVQRRMAFIGDALAHTTLPGLVVAHLFGWSLSLGGLGAALATALLIGWASRRQAVKEDTAIGVVFTGMFALGVLLMSLYQPLELFSAGVVVLAAVGLSVLLLKLVWRLGE